MSIERLPGRPRSVPLPKGADALYEIDLTADPSPAWWRAFLHPSPRLTSTHGTPEVGYVGVYGSTVHFRTTPDRLEAWLHRIDGWIEYANSVVKE